MIQTLHTTYYTVTKYKGSYITLPSTYDRTYNLSETLHSNHRVLSDWIDVCKENCKRFTKVQQKKNVRTEIISKTLLKKERRKTYLANDKLAYFNKVNHPNYNPFSPLFDAEAKGSPRSVTMEDEIARARFLKVMNGEFDDDDDDNINSTTPTTKTNNNANYTESSALIEDKDTPLNETNQVELADKAATSGKKHIIENEAILALISETHAPRNLTWESDYKTRKQDHLEGTYNNNFGLVIRIGQKKNQKLRFHEGRILTAILRSFQQVSPYIKIVPFDKKRSNISDITSPDQILFDEEFYSYFIEEPIVSINSHYICRIHFSSTKPFFWYKKNVYFQKWLSQEMIRLEENNIKEIHCPKVGFLTQCHPRASLIKVFEERIKQSFIGCQYPQFYCTIEHISVRQTTTKVIVIRSAEKNVMEMLDLFKKSQKLHMHTFVPWREWNAMISTKQLDLIQRQNKNITSSKSIILSGFKDNVFVKFNYSLIDTDEMIYRDENEKENSAETKDHRNVTVEEFLYKHYKDCDGKRLFQYIYPVALGVREILVQHRHANEAIELCKEIKEDMFMYMSLEAAEEIFENVEDIKDKAINHSLWEPFCTPHYYKEAYDQPTATETTAERTISKRSSETEPHKYPKLSYAQVTNNKTKPSSKSSGQIEQNNSQSTHNARSQNLLSEEMKLVRQQLLELKNKQDEQENHQKSFQSFQAKQEQSNNHILAEIKRTNDHINNNIMTTIEKTHNDISNIEKQMFTIQDLNSKVNSVLQFVQMHIQGAPLNQHSQFRTSNDMMIDKEINKRNHNGNLRDDNGNISWAESNKENTSTGGNQNKCILTEPDSFGNCHP
jgi:hypothetical protein